MSHLNENQIFQYNGSPITFQKGDSVMVNATEMAKPFGKLVGDWTRQKSTQEFLQTLSTVRGIPISAIIQIIKGGNSEQGTWMHEDVAIEFARWLSPSFAIWCNDRIKELLTIGMTATQPTLEQMIGNPDLVIQLATQLKTEREEKKRLKSENEQKKVVIEAQSNELKVAAPKVEYYDKVLSSEGLLTVNMVAACINMTSKALNKKLVEIGVQYKESGVYFLKSHFQGFGFTQHKPYPYIDHTGRQRTTQHMYWKEIGKKFILLIHEYGWDVRKAFSQIKKELSPAA